RFEHLDDVVGAVFFFEARGQSIVVFWSVVIDQFWIGIKIGHDYSSSAGRESALGRTGWCDKIEMRFVRFMVIATHCTAAYCSSSRAFDASNCAAMTLSMSLMRVVASASWRAARSSAVYRFSASHQAESAPSSCAVMRVSMALMRVVASAGWRAARPAAV